MSAFISLHFGFVGLHFLAFWPCGPSFPCILSLHFLAFWPCGPLFPCILGLHFLAFWPCEYSFPCIAGLHFLSFPVKPFPSANDPCLKWVFCLRPCQVCKSTLPEMGFFVCVSARNGLVAGQTLALYKRPLPEMGFFACAPAGNGPVAG